MSAIHTITSREFNQHASAAKKQAAEGPVFITDRGEPAFVLMNISDYRQLAGGPREISLLQLMDSLPSSSEVEDFEIAPLEVDLRPGT